MARGLLGISAWFRVVGAFGGMNRDVIIKCSNRPLGARPIAKAQRCR